MPSGTRVLGLLLAAALLTGCAQIPSGGSVQLAPPGAAQSGGELGSEFLYFSPTGPTPGASREEILSGFFSAATGPQNDFAVAREFLTEELRQSWNPNRQVLVQSTAPLVTFAESDEAVAQVQIQAIVDEQGGLTISDSDEAELLTFQLEQQDGEWRISQAPDLTMVIRPVFDVIYKAYSLYFLDSTSRYLVPDVRWFPARASTPNRIVSALLGGPSPWLEGAVQNPIERAGSLGEDDVSINGGVARVNFDELSDADVTTRLPLIDAQLRASLQQVTSITSVEVAVKGERVGFQPVLLPDALQPVQSAIALGQDGRISQLLSGSLAEIPDLRSIVAQAEASWVQLANDSRLMALGSSSAQYLVDLSTPSRRLRSISSGAELPVPFFDRYEYLWRWSEDRAGTFEIVAGNLSRSTIELQWPSNQQILAASMSPDGMRLAVVTSSSFGQVLWLMSVVRDINGKPIALGLPFALGPDLVSVRDVTWLDMTTVAVLDERTPGASSVLLLSQGGFSRSLSALRGGTRIIGTGSVNSIFALNAEGQIFQYRGMTWVDTANTAIWITVR